MGERSHTKGTWPDMFFNKDVFFMFYYTSITL